MKMAFAGAVEGSRRALSALCAHGLAPDLVVTLPPQAADRHSDFADLAAVARGAGCDVHFTRNINHDDTCQVLEAMEPDIILVIGWSQLCHERFRNIPAIGLIGFHPAPLPAFRGRAAIPWTILARLDQTAATLFWIDEGCDTGDILMQSPFAVTHDETARTLYDKHIEALCKMLPRAVEQVANGQITRIRQDPLRASYCARRRPEDGRIDWTRPAQELDRLVRAVGAPYPGAFTEMDGHKIIIEAARVHDSAPSYIGLPGQIQEVDAEQMRVSCGDFSCLEVTRWRSEMNQLPRRHAVLGSAGQARP